jgi:hypothetical protein
MPRLPAVAPLGLSLLLLASLLLVATWTQPCAADRTLFRFPTFAPANSSSLLSANSARIVNGTLQITAHDPGTSPTTVRAAAAWFVEPVRGESFRTTFTMRFTNYTFTPGLGNRDGIAFVLRVGDSQVAAVAPDVGGIGYGETGVNANGIRRSLAIEFDTYKDDALGDPTRNHYQVHTQANASNSAFQSAAVGGYRNEPFFNDNEPHTVVIEYLPGTLNITVDGALEPMSIPLDLNTLFGAIDEGVIVGFTGSTQGVGETQEILSWDYVYLGNTGAANSEAYGPGKEESVAGLEATFTIQAVDQFGFNITQGGDDFAVTINATSSDPPATPVQVTLKDNEDGTYSVSYRGTTATTYTVHAFFQGNDIKGSPWTMILNPAAIDPTQCVAAGSLTGGTAGESLTLEVQAKDAFANKVGKQDPDAGFVARFSNGLALNFTPEAGAEGLYKTAYTIEEQGVYSIEVLFANASASVPIQGSPWANCTIVPADPVAAECYAVGEGLEFAIAGLNGTFSIVARDRFNNTLYNGLPSSFSFKGTVTGGTTDTPVTIAEVKGENDTVAYAGSYAATTSGDYQLNILLGDQPIAGSPFPISIVASNSTWGPECVAYGAGLSSGLVGATQTFVIQARDPFGNNMTYSNATFTVVFAKQQRLEQASDEVTYNITQDAADKGKFIVTYSTVVAGKYSITVSLDGKEIKGSPFEATMAPGALYAQDCVARGAGLTRHDKNTNMTFTIFTMDVFGNPLGKGGALFIVNVTDRFNAFEGKGQVRDNGDGTYGVVYSVPKAGHYRLSATTADTNIRGSPWFFSIDGESMPETEKNLIIAGSVIGAVLLLAFVVGLAILYVRRRRSQYTVLA